MIPVSAWRYIVAKVREQYPDTVFLLEGLGGKISVTRELLNTANLNWAYSELFQNYDRHQIEHYLPEAIDISNSDGITVHFAETHDNPRLAGRSKIYAQMRTALCALCSHNGAFGFANGVEWFATEKINVHDSPPLNWGSESNQIAQIRRINHLLKVHPAFHEGAKLKLIGQNEGNYLVVLRDHQASGKKLLVVVNLDAENPTQATWNPTAAGITDTVFTNLLSDDPVTVSTSNDQHILQMEPGQVVCLSPDRSDLQRFHERTEPPFLLPERIEQQRDIEALDMLQAARQLKENPFKFCKRLNPHIAEPRVIVWQWPRDLKREVMIPPDHFLLIRVDCAFRAQIIDHGKTLASEESLPDANGSYFALVSPLTASKTAETYTLKLSLYFSEGCRHAKAPVCILPWPERVGTRRIYQHSELLQKQFVFLATNDHGAMSRSVVSWAKLASRYDGLLAANMSPAYPEDRWMMFSRCRAWVVFQGYSQEINSHCLEAFKIEQRSKGSWQYHIPTGQGENVLLSVSVEMIDDQNAVRLNFLRHPAGLHQDRLANAKPIKLILRPDIENRNCHSTTKAYAGPEDHWPNSVKPVSDGFQFSPDAAHHLQMQLSEGTFVREPEWQYMVHRSTDAERGQDPDSDLFSPGYFEAFVQGGQQVTLWAQVNSDNATSAHLAPDPGSMTAIEPDKDHERIEPIEILKSSLDQYVVKRGDLKTVIAGYPWFLDWGRDALICVRGLVAAEKLADARAVVKQFGRFEDRGTLPNMIQGNDAGNRDTSDAALWFFTACADLVAAEQSGDFLQTECGGRSVREVLLSIGQFMVSGTPNGIGMDPASGLIFSPIHFSWMDTNHPAGTPRQGYPIEIQALWYAALCFLSKIDPSQTKADWQTLAEQVQRSILTHYWLDDGQYLSDCLHAAAETPAKDAIADDGLRPNQLLAITLGAVSDPIKCEFILAACQELLVPGAIRSLADRPVRQPLKIVHQGKLINDPLHPYQGKYAGDEDTRRKPAYHNGTAWTWLFPSFCEAWAMTYGAEGKKTALAWLSSSIRLLEQGCLDHIPEILDGDYPHTQRGCDAQAWGASELLRVWLKLEKEKIN
jgi:predicted glycogen debranching enzyme